MPVEFFVFGLLLVGVLLVALWLLTDLELSLRLWVFELSIKGRKP